MIASVVQHQHHAPPGCLLAQQALEKTLERGGVENRAHHANELTTVQADGAKAGNGLAGRRMLQDWILDFRRYPHATARAVLLEVTFIQTPQFDVGTAGQASRVFLLLRNFQRSRLQATWGQEHAKPKAQFSEKSLTLPHTEVHSISPTQVFRQHRPVP